MTTATLDPNIVTEQPAVDPLADEAGVEFVDGQIVEKPVSVESSEVGATISWLLRTEAAKTREARVFDSSIGYRCFPEEPTRFRKPNVSLIRVERLANTNREDGYIQVPPDLAVEVASPNDLAYDLTAKLQEYLANGFGLVWVVYPNTKSVVVYRSDKTSVTLNADQEITGESALPGFRCKVGAFFDVSG